MAKYPNTKPMRVYSDSEQFLRDIARIRRNTNKDKLEVSPARVLKAYINETKNNKNLYKRITEARFE